MLFPFLPFMVQDFFPHLGKEELGKTASTIIVKDFAWIMLIIMVLRWVPYRIRMAPYAMYQ